MAKGWFVTGTDTGIGKTRVAQALLAAAAGTGKRVVGMKPVSCGCHNTSAGLVHDDAEALILGSNVSTAYADVNPYAFAPTISPHLAAREAGVAIQLDVIRACFARLAGQTDYLVVEGAGGWSVPINDTQSMADVAEALQLPVVLVVGMRLGCLNHALLTQAAIAQSSLPFAGWIANCIDPTMERLDDNVATLEKRLNAPLLAVFAHTPETLPLASIAKLSKSLFNSD